MFRLRPLKNKTLCTRQWFCSKTGTDGITYFQHYVFLRINRFQNATFEHVLCINFYSRRSYRGTGPGTRNARLKTVYYESSRGRVTRVSEYRCSRDVETLFSNNNDLRAGRRAHTAACAGEHELRLARRLTSDRVPENIDNDCGKRFPGREGGEWTRLKRIYSYGLSPVIGMKYCRYRVHDPSRQTTRWTIFREFRR